MLWQRYPLFRVFLAFCFGILLTNFFSISTIYVKWLVLLMFFVFSLSLVNQLFFKHQLRVLFGGSILLLFFSLGAWCSQLYQRQAQLDNIESFTKEGIYQLRLTQSSIDKDYAYRAEAKIVRLDTAVKLSTKALLYLEKDSINLDVPAYGDVFIYKGSLRILQVPKNPYEFDYKNYLNLRSVYVSGYITSDNLNLIHRDSTSFMSRVKYYRAKLLAVIDSWELPPKQTQISKALLLGYRNDVDAELLKAYSAVGAMHVLAVSGLHIGIVYLVLAKMLFFLRKKREKLLKSLLLILALWGYACITGLSPSVVRASTMFTFVAIGVAFRRNTSIYNTLLVSALFLLFIKPTYLFEVGFQLSYLAVFGIVWLQPKFEKLIHPPTWILRQLWTITTVSIAAQIATFPLGLYYFHQFPGLFLVSNLIVIPLVTLLMYVGLLLLIISVIFDPFDWLIWVYSKLLWLMNNGVAAVEKMDGFLFEQIHISRIELVLFYLFIGFSFQFLFTKKYKMAVVSLLLMIALQTYQVWENVHLNNTNAITFYSIKNQEAIGLRSGNDLYFLADTSLLHNDGKLTFHAKHHWWASNIKEVHYLPLDTSFTDDKLMLKNGNIQFLDTKLTLNANGLTNADYYLVNQPFDDDLLTHPAKGIIVGNTLKEKERLKWLGWAKQEKVALVKLTEEGAFETSWTNK